MMRFLRAFGRQSERAHKERQFARLGPIERRLISVRNFEADSRESPRSGYTSEKAANGGDLSIYVEPFHELEAANVAASP